MTLTVSDSLSFCGHALSESEWALIRQVTREFSSLALTELAATVCELLGWRRRNGRLKSRECYLFLRELYRRGELAWLPAPQPRCRRSRPAAPAREADEPAVLISGSLQSYRPLRLERIEDNTQRREFRHCLAQYHYLGYRAPYGAQLRYWVRAAQSDLPPLAALLFTGAAWRMAPRDRYIGWSEAARKANLPRIVNHSRFLIPPWTRIPHLASHVLAQAAQQVPRDWLECYGVEPLLLETLVDTTRYRGICYRAANWIEVGLTQGRGRMDRLHRAALPPKQIFLYPLHRRWRRRLCDPASGLSQPVR